MQTHDVTKQFRGVSLIETVVTLGVVVLLITGLVVGMTSSLRNAQASKARSLAIQSAQQALEIVRQVRDSSWATFEAYNTTIGNQKAYCTDSGQLDILTESCLRVVTFTRISIDQMDVTVTISWREASLTKNVSLKTTYTNWK